MRQDTPEPRARQKPLHIGYDKTRGGTVPMLDIQERGTIERIVAKDGLKFAFGIWLMIRLTLSLWAVLIVMVAPPESHAHVLRDYPDVQLPDRDFQGLAVGLWNIYDTRHYITIAETGYSSDPGYLTAFFPGYPILIKLVSFLLLGQPLLAAVLVSNIAALLFFWY